MYENFKKLLSEKKITPYKVAKETGISQSTLSDWKNGKSSPKYDKLIRIANYLNVDVNTLTGNSLDIPSGRNELPEQLLLIAQKTNGLSKNHRETIYNMINNIVDDALALIDSDGCMQK